MDRQGRGSTTGSTPPKGSYRIEIAPAALSVLRRMPPDAQERLRQMLLDVASLAEGMALQHEDWRGPNDSNQLLHLMMGQSSIRYSLDDAGRTLTVQHISGA